MAPDMGNKKKKPSLLKAVQGSKGMRFVMPFKRKTETAESQQPPPPPPPLQEFLVSGDESKVSSLTDRDGLNMHAMRTERSQRLETVASAQQSIQSVTPLIVVQEKGSGRPASVPPPPSIDPSTTQMPNFAYGKAAAAKARQFSPPKGRPRPASPSKKPLPGEAKQKVFTKAASLPQPILGRFPSPKKERPPTSSLPAVKEMDLDSGLKLSAPSPFTLDRVVLQKNHEHTLPSLETLKRKYPAALAEAIYAEAKRVGVYPVEGGIEAKLTAGSYGISMHSNVSHQTGLTSSIATLSQILEAKDDAGHGANDREKTDDQELGAGSSISSGNIKPQRVIEMTTSELLVLPSSITGSGAFSASKGDEAVNQDELVPHQIEEERKQIKSNIMQSTGERGYQIGNIVDSKNVASNRDVALFPGSFGIPAFPHAVTALLGGNTHDKPPLSTPKNSTAVLPMAKTFSHPRHKRHPSTTSSSSSLPGKIDVDSRAPDNIEASLLIKHSASFPYHHTTDSTPKAFLQ
jgi:hypothetical protein